MSVNMNWVGKTHELANSEKTISIEMISEIVRSHAIGLRNAVATFKLHPSYDTRQNLANRSNELAGMFHLLLKLNGYKEIKDSDVREQVTNARLAVALLFKK